MFGQFGPAHSFKISAYQAEDSDDKGASSQICAAKFLHRRNFHFGGRCEPERQKFNTQEKDSHRIINCSIGELQLLSGMRQDILKELCYQDTAAGLE